jgi:DNA polymerase-3 subunit alpha
LNKEDHFAHDVLCCISMGRLVGDEGRLKYPTELYLKSPDEMKSAVGSFDQAMEKHRAHRRDVQSGVGFFSKRYAPVYKVPTEKLKAKKSGATKVTKEDEQYLRQLLRRGLDWRYSTARRVERNPRAARQRARHHREQKLLLILFDRLGLLQLRARERDSLSAREVRASARWWVTCSGPVQRRSDQVWIAVLSDSGSVASEMPDIDIDICQDGRGKVIDYVRNKVRARRADHHVRHARGEGGV